MRIVISLMMLLALSSEYAGAKCARIFIRVNGSVETSNAHGLVVRVAVDPEPNEPESLVRVVDRRFEARVAFDPTSGTRRGRDRCARSPSAVEVALLRRDEVVGRKTLKVSVDFERNREGDYVAKAPVLFQDGQLAQDQ